MALTKVTQSVLDYQPFSSGTVMLFQQSTAPTGWTKVTTHNDKALRVVSGSVSSGGSVAFSTAFVSQAVSGSVSGSVGSTTLSTAQIPSHTHGVYTWATTSGGSGFYSGNYSNPQYSNETGATGGNGSHNHSFSGSFSGTAINMAVQYVDVIFATKD